MEKFIDKKEKKPKLFLFSRIHTTVFSVCILKSGNFYLL